MLVKSRENLINFISLITNIFEAHSLVSCKHFPWRDFFNELSITELVMNLSLEPFEKKKLIPAVHILSCQENF